MEKLYTLERIADALEAIAKVIDPQFNPDERKHQQKEEAREKAKADLKRLEAQGVSDDIFAED